MAAIKVERIHGPARRAIIKGLLAFNKRALGKLRVQAALGHAPCIGAPSSAVCTRETYLGWMFIVAVLGGRTSSEAKASDRRSCRRPKRKPASAASTNVYLDTFSFQAPGFYKKLGYREFGKLKDFPAGHSPQLADQGAVDVLELQTQDARPGIADRAVQARGDRLPARDRAQERARGHLCRRASRRGRRQGPPARAGAQALDRRRPRSCAAMPNSIALKLACHDPGVHRKLVPGGQTARAVFDAVEQARVEAIGARRMSGVAKNLTAMLDDRFHRGKFDEVTDRADAPIEDALAMLVRERLTGQAPPAAAQAAGRAVASADRGPRRQGPRPARKADREPGAVRRRRPRPARLARHGRGPHLRLRRGGGRGGRPGPARRTRPARKARAPRPTTPRPRPTIPPRPARTCRNRPPRRRTR